MRASARRDAGIKLIIQTRDDEEAAASVEVMQTWAADLGAYADMLRSDRERLGELTSDDAAEAAAWSVVVADGDGLITQLEERSTLVATGDWQRIVDELTFGVDIGGDEVRAALDELGLSGPDCELLHTSMGVAESGREFVTEAATPSSRRDRGSGSARTGPAQLHADRLT